MRNIFIFLAALLVAAFTSVSAVAADREWKDAPGGLPYYKYTGNRTGDPAILLGNSRIKVRAHLSGIYELISGERCWGRFNADPLRPDYGKNRATVYVGNKAIQLVGQGSLAVSSDKCEVYSGAGFVRYDYDLGNGLKCSRMISVMPSETPDGGEPLFLVTVTFTNENSTARTISYDEALTPHYVQSSYQLVPEEDRPFRYALSTEISFRCIKATFSPIPQNFAMLSVPGARSLDESDPHSLFLYSDNAFLVVNEGELKATVNDIKVRGHKSHSIHIVVGFSGANNKETAEKAIARGEINPCGMYASLWKKHLPDFSSERNKNVRNELYRSAYSIEASAVYNDYFKETYIPGKFLYSTRFGENVTNSDHINAALQACYTHPELAKSIIRYVMKQTSYDGMLPDSNKGFGYIPSDAYKYNLMQLEIYNVMTEYLKRTRDYEFLDEWLNMYPLEKGEMQTVKSVLETYFIYLRSQTYTSPTMAAMQAAFLPGFVEQMELSGRMSDDFIGTLKKYTQKSVERFKEQKNFSMTDLPYLLLTESLTTSTKRDLIDDAIRKGAADFRSIPGLATFDGIEASSLFRSLITKSEAADDADVYDALAIYAYYRMME